MFSAFLAPHKSFFSVLHFLCLFDKTQKQTMDVQVTTQVFQWTLPTDEDNDSL